MKEQAAAIVGRWLKEEEGELELILCNNDDMALGAIETLSQEGRTDISVVGIDGTEEGLMAVRDGKMLGTVKADSDIYAEYIARMVCGLKKKERCQRKSWKDMIGKYGFHGKLRSVQNWENRECKSAQIYRIKII